MAGPSISSRGPHLGGRRLVGVIAALLFASVLVGIPAEPAAHAALGGLTNFEIDGNTVVNGPSPPSGGAGIDWANASSFLQDVNQPMDPCGANPDPTTVTGVKLDTFDPFAPNPHPANISAKNDICQGYIAWEPVEVTTGGVTSIHFVLYGGWRRQVGVTGDMSFFIPLIGGPNRSNVTLVEFDFNPPTTTLVGLLRWNGVSWVLSPPPVSTFQSAVSPVSPPAFGEFAIDLTASGVLPASGTCVSVVSTYVMTRPGNGNADLADFVGFPPVQMSNCSPIRITKTTTPEITNGPVNFTYTLHRTDGGPVQDNTPLTPPNTDSNPSLNVIAGTLTLPTEPTDIFTNIFAASSYQLLEDLPPPAPWSHQSIICNYFNPLILDANNHATPATATLTNPDGSPTGQTFTVAPVGLLPPGANFAADCTISNHAPSLALAKQVVNTVGNAPAAPDMWLLSATPTSPSGPAIDYGPGTSDGVAKPVAPNTYTLAETTNPANPPPLGYAAGPWSCVDAAGNPVTVTGGNQIAIGDTQNFTCTITNTAQDLARLTLNKVVVGGTATAGQFTLSAVLGNESGAIDNGPISGVTGAASVTNRPVKRGLFTLSESGGPVGYLPSWRCTDATGAVISDVSSVVIPAQFTVPNQLVITCTVTNTFTPLSVQITGSAVNPVGRSHTFTLTATRSDTGAPLPGALLDLTFDGVVGTVTANTCQTPPGTNANGQCTVTVTSAAPGQFAINVNGFTNQGPNGPNPGQPFPFDTPVSSTKTWTMYRVTADSSINVVGNNSHTFTLTGTRNFGTGEQPMQPGTVITYTWSGAEPADPPSQCTVDASGTCDVTVTNSTTQPANGTLTVTSIIVNLPNGTGSGNTTQFTIQQGDTALIAALPAPTKNWIAFRIQVEPTDINLVGQPHTFTVTAEYSTEPGVFQPVNGGTVDFSFASGVAAIDPSSTCPTLSAVGTCTVTVVQGATPQPGTGTLAVTGLSNPGITVNGQPTIFTDPIPNGPNSAALDLSAATAQKTWVLVGVNITPGVDNLAGESHTFTVQVTGFDGDGPFPDGSGVENAIVTSSAVSIVGGATVTGDTCSVAPGTNATGQCTITVSNTGSGSIRLQLDQVSVTIDGKDFVIPLVPGTRGVPTDQVFPIQTDKVWWQYRVVLSNSSVNPLGVSHTFTATVQRSNDGTNDANTTWVPVPDGAILDSVWIDPNAVSHVDPSSTCLTTGTIDGICTFVVTSTGPTTGTLDIRAIAATWLDRNRNGQSGAPTDPIPNPVEFANEIVRVPDAAFGFGANLTASKTWWDFAVDVSGPSENPVGTDHTFIATVRFSDGISGFQPVATGTTLTYTWTGPTGSAEDTTRSTCDPTDGPGTNISGQCTVVIASPTVPGTGTLTITGIDSTTIPEPTREVSFTFPTPGTTTKTWIAYRALISPSSTNLAGTPHPFTITVQQDRGDGNGFVAVPDGTTIAVAATNPTTVTGNTCSGGTVGGTCTVTVSSNNPGAVTVTPGAITVSLLNGTGGRVPVTVLPGSPAYAAPEGATKTWVSVAVSVAPPTATNLVGLSHTFTVHVDVIGADGTTTPQPAPDGATVEWTFNGPGTISAGATTCDTIGTAGGTCDITFTNSGTPGFGTLTITSVTFTANGQEFTVDLTQGGPPQATPPPVTATKTWRAYAVTVTPSANNPVGTQHNFVITATVNDGTSTSPAAGATIAFTWGGAGTLVTPSPCTTAANGTCIVSVSSPAAGTGTLTVTSLTDNTGAVVDLMTVGAPGQAANQVVPLTASKTWMQYRVLLEAAATNLTGDPHTFTATVQQTGAASPGPADWTAVPNGTTLTASASGTGSLDPASTCFTSGTTAGMCSFVVHDAGPGTLELTVTAIATTTVDGAPFANVALTTPATTSKTWVSVAVDVTPPAATNLVGRTHTFTVHVNVIGADGTTTPQPAPDEATVTWAFTGPGTIDGGATTCNDIGTVAGTCDITFTNNGIPGAGTLTITSVTFVANGETFTVDLAAAGPGQATPPPITATKLWVAYTVTVTPAAANPVNRDHQFTIHATRSDGVEVAGATITYTWTGAGAAAPPTQCTTSATGSCIVTVSSTAAGTGTLTVTSLTDSSGALVDLTTLGAPGQSAGQQIPLTTTKTWLQYRVLLSPDTTNLVGQPHTFTATVQQSAVANPTPADWVPVADGTTLTASAAGAGALDPASTCLSGGTSAGTCTFVVHDAGPGTLDLTVTAVAETTIGGVSFTGIALNSPATASKTWVSVAVSVAPPTATNVAGQSHTFTVHVNLLGADGTTTPRPAPEGTTLAWTFVGPGVDDPAGTTCATPGTSAGTCTITLANSGTAGSGTLTIDSVSFVANGRPFTVDLSAPGPGQATPPPITASKSWSNYRVTVTPATATNFVTESHTFTVLVERDTGTGFLPLPDVPVTLTATGTAVPDPPIPTSCTTDTAGRCEITTSSAVPGTLTITATYVAASDAGAVPFSGSAQKEWQAGWTLRIAKASSVTNSTQLFAFQTDGPAPLTGGSFSLAIGQSQLFEGLLPGTYTVTELTDAAHLPRPWRLESLVCNGVSRGATVAIDGSTATLTLAPPSPGSEITCTYTNERMNLFVHKTDGGATPVAGGAPFNYTITVGNDGSVASTAPITVTDTLPDGLAFAGSPQVPAGGTCAPPVGQVLTCTLTASIAPGATVQIIVPARALTTAGTSVVNVVKIDSSEDLLCPDGTCPPPPECPAPASTVVTVAAITVGGDPSDNQACVRTAVSPESVVGPEAGGSSTTTTSPPETTPPETGPATGILPRTGSSAMPIALAGLCIIWGVAAMIAARRRRARRSV
jgi:fimbrial isopeptide formation D2 family protein